MPRFVWGAVRWLAFVLAACVLAAACGSSTSVTAPQLSPEGGPGSGLQFGEGGAQGTCVPKTCAELGIECGPAGDGCGGIVKSCGTCADGTRCGGPGAPSKCVVPTAGDGGACSRMT